MINAMKKMMALLLAIVMVLLASPFAVLAEGLIEEELNEVTVDEQTEITPVTSYSNTVTAVNLLDNGETAEPTYLEQIAALQAEAEALDPESETLQDDCADIYTRLMAVYEPAAAEYQAGTITEEEYNEIYNATGAVMGILYGYGFDPNAIMMLSAITMGSTDTNSDLYTRNASDYSWRVTNSSGNVVDTSIISVTAGNNGYLTVTTNGAAAGTYNIQRRGTYSSWTTQHTVTVSGDGSGGTTGNDEIWSKYGTSSVIVALRTDGTIPGEPAVQGESGYIYFNGSYSGQKDSYQTFANSASGIVDSSIVNHEHFNTDNPDTSMGLALSSGTNPATMVSGVNFETALLNAAKANYASSVIINGTDGMTLAEAYAVYGNNITQYYEIFPYVVKIENNYGYWMWHIDCAIRPKANVTLSYNINVPSGMTYPSSITVPNSESALPPADFNIGSVGGLTNSKMTVEDSSGGEYEFTFLGWNTKADGSGDWYYPDGEITDVMVDTILYAIWDSNPAIGTGNFRIAKNVVVPDGETIDTDQSFTFTVAIHNADGTAATGTYPYTLYGANGVAVSGGAGTIQNGGTLTLKHGQYVLLEDLPAVNDDTSEYKNVTVTETNIPDGYTPSWEGTTGDSTSVKIEGGRTSDVTCINTKAVQNTSVTATKVWSDSENAYSTRPDSITLQLNANGYASGDPVTVTPDATTGAWTYTWSDLPINDSDGNPIAYTVAEAAVPGYTANITGDAETGFTVTNTLNSYILTVKKTVSGNMGDQAKEFDFDVNVAGTNNEVQLHHDEIQTYTVPYGATVTITEDAAGYAYSLASAIYVNGVDGNGNQTTAAITTRDAETGTGVTFTMPAGSATVVINNDKTAEVDTGILLDSLPYVLILAAVGAALVLWFIRKRRVED